MKAKKTAASTKPANPAKASKASKAEIECSDDYGATIKLATARAKKVIAVYVRLDPRNDRHCIVTDILYDLMHLCEQDPTLGDFEDGCERALQYHCDELAEENEWLAGEVDRMEGEINRMEAIARGKSR